MGFHRTAFLGLVTCTLLASSALIVAACSDDDETQVNTTNNTPDAQTDTSTEIDAGPNCPPVQKPACTNSACTAQAGEPAVCVEGKCVKLKTSDCPLAYGPIDDDNVVVIGSSHANRGPNKAPGDQCNDVMKFAVDEINKLGGIPSSDACKPAKKLAFVACDETNFFVDGGTYTLPADAGPSPRQQSWTHLANDLKVPVIFGGATSGDGIALGQWVIPQYKTMVFASRASSPALVNIPADGFQPDGYRLMWRGSQNLAVEAEAARSLYGQLETDLKAARAKATLKVAIVLKNDPFGQPFGAALRAQGLNVNGTPYTGTQRDDVLDVTFQFVDGVGAGEAKQTVRDKLLAFAPDVIIIVASDEGVTEFMQPLEASYQANAVPEAQRPYWIGARGLRSISMTTYVDSITDAAQKTSFLKRVRGLVPGRITALSQDFFNLRFKAAYPNAQLVDGVRELYDMTYMTAYVMAAAASKGAIDAKALVDNVPSILSGTEGINVGPTSYVSTVKRLAAGEKINLNGTFSAMDYDTKTGETPVDTSVWCIAIDPNTGKSLSNLTTGQYYDAAQKKLVGTFKCE